MIVVTVASCIDLNLTVLQFYIELAAILYIHIVSIIMKTHGTSSTRCRLESDRSVELQYKRSNSVPVG